MVMAGLGILIVILAKQYLARDKQPRLDGEEIRNLRRVSEQVRRESAFPFD